MKDPWTTERLADLEKVAQRKKRRSQLRLLWTLLVLMLLGQAAVAYYSYRRHVAAAAARVSPGSGLAERDAALAAGLDAGEREVAGAAADATTVAIRPDARRRPAKPIHRRRHRDRKRRERASGARPTEAAGPVHDLKLPEKVMGSAERGERIFRMGCGLCHGRTTRRLSPARYGAKGWRRFFASSQHGRHDLFRSNFTRVELSDVKAYLISRSE